MRLNTLKTVRIFLVILISMNIIAACAGKDDNWPVLTSDVPNAKERDRAIERVSPAKYDNTATSTNISTESAADTLIKDVKSLTQKETDSYLQAKQRYTNLDAQEKNDAWFGLQLALTRLSHSGSKLDALLDSQNTNLTGYIEEAASLKTSVDAFVISERQALAAIKPK
jgi:archaellum biogenesis ATPase FlaH